MHYTNTMVRTADLAALRLQDAERTTNVIIRLNYRQEIFGKHYEAPKPVVDCVQHVLQYDHGDEFFKNLPYLTSSQMKVRALPLPKSYILTQRIMVL